MSTTNIITSTQAMEQWQPQFPWPTPDGHKYTRGHALVMGGGLRQSGASRLSAESALRAAAGAVTLIAPNEDTMKCNIGRCPNAVMHNTVDEIAPYLADERITSVIIGPGFGHGAQQKQMIQAIIDSGKRVVMDADALDTPRVNPNAVITPHEGEFARLFPDMTGTREEKALKAAQITQSIVLLKGKHTVVASPDGRIMVNESAPPELATAGSGDTLSGIIGGLLAAGMPKFEAAMAGVFIHSRAGELAGKGAIADDFVENIPQVLQELSQMREHSHTKNLGRTTLR